MGAGATAEDPRYVRSRAALVDAVLELAASRPAEQITVRELTDLAHVSRQTFYSHSSSPADLLTEVLLEDLAPTDEHLLGPLEADRGESFRAVWTASFRETLEHVRRFADIYSAMLESGSVVYNRVLSWMVPTAHRFVGAAADQSGGEPPTRLWVEMAARQQVNNLSSAIQAWAATGFSAPIETVLETYLTLVPPWQLARRDLQGRINLYGRRGTPPQAS